MNNIAFTICAKNYLGLALTLKRSIELHNDDFQFYVFVADEIDNSIIIDKSDFIFNAKDVLNIDAGQWDEMSFKYDITEFCTSIKAHCFEFLFHSHPNSKVIYFDPDILTFASLKPILNDLEKYSIILTPHITTIEENYTGSLNERNLLYSGMYNLGFLALKNNVIGNKLVQWWKIRLKDRCFQNMMENYFTDQKWIDFIPSFFPNETLITNNLGLNVAPWNFHERKVEKIENTYFVKNRITNSQVLYPLIFIHFSGYNYGALISEQNEIEKKGKSIFYQEINEVIDFYSTKLKQANISQYLGLSYKYSCFENGISISKIHRKLYRRLIEDGNISGNPFDVKGDFYHSLKRNGLTSKLIVESDKVGVNNVNNLESKTIVINKVFRILFKVIGSKRYFLLVRLMRLYSKPENHVYLIDKNYLKRFKIWS